MTITDMISCHPVDIRGQFQVGFHIKRYYVTNIFGVTTRIKSKWTHAEIISSSPKRGGPDKIPEKKLKPLARLFLCGIPFVGDIFINNITSATYHPRYLFTKG